MPWNDFVRVCRGAANGGLTFRMYLPSEHVGSSGFYNGLCLGTPRNGCCQAQRRGQEFRRFLETTDRHYQVDDISSSLIHIH